MTEFVLAKGDKVVATLRKPESLSDLKDKHSLSNLLIAKFDVTKHQEILNTFVQAKRVFGNRHRLQQRRLRHFWRSGIYFR